MVEEHCDIESAVREFFSPGGPLAGEFPSYEHRPGQVELACAVARALGAEEQRFLAAEAGTGVGKTLAYLLPAVLCGRRVVVSTATLNLQEEIISRAIPLLERVLARRIRACGVKGRRNYLCLARFRQVEAAAGSLFGVDEDVRRLAEWLDETDAGDRSEIGWLADDSPIWREVCCDPEQCAGGECPEFSLCFLTRLRRRAAASDIVVVNHHLFFSDLALRSRGFGEVVPRYEAVIFDEAHHIEDVAGRYFGLGFSSFRVRDLAADLERAAAACSVDGLDEEIKLVRSRVEALTAAFPPRPGRYDYGRLMGEDSPLPPLLSGLRDAMFTLARAIDRTGAGLAGAELFRSRAESIADDIGQFCGEACENMVYWGERRERSVAFMAVPVEVAPVLAENLYSETKAVIFCSATLTCGGSFDYMAGSLGLPEEAETLVIEPPFDYRNRSLLFVPEKGFPAPSSPDSSGAVAETVARLASICPGGTLALFTSVASMRRCHELLAAAELDMPVLVQGEAPRSHLLERFRSGGRSLLLAVASFWEGIDVPGEALACVVIDKLPFEVPDDPVVKARSEAVERRGGRPFFDLQVPRAVLSLRQGVGRLMRVAGDYGVMAVLDIRLRTKPYGRIFLESLPSAPLVATLGEVERFYRSFENAGGSNCLSTDSHARRRG